MAVSDLVYIDSTGYNCADAPTFLAFFQGQIQGVYGSDIYLGSDSQDGQMIGILSQAIYDTAQVGQAVYNSLSPVTAQGAGLSRIVKINGLRRQVPSNSTVELVIVGVYGTTLTNAIAIDSLQQQWMIPNVTIPASGTVTVTATAATSGAITAQPNTVTGIYTPTVGWQTVTNPTAATAGAPVESDAALRVRQAASTTLPAQTAIQTVEAAVTNVAGVTQAVAYENASGSVDGNGLPAHSIAIVAEGGLDSAVASAIQIAKGPGAPTYGTTTVALSDSRGMPININFFRPTVAAISAQVTVTPLASWNSSTIALIQTAVAAAIAAFPIGADIVLTQLYVKAYLLGTPQAGSFNVVSILLQKNGGGFVGSDIQLAFNEIPACDPTSVAVAT